MDALSKFGHFEFGINSAQEAKLAAQKYGEDFVDITPFDSEDDLMTVIKGLHWE